MCLCRATRKIDSLFRANYRNGRINYFRLSEQNHDVEVPKAKLELGEAVVVREGSDITVAVVGPMLQNVMRAVKTVVDGGIDAEVLYFPTIKPFDGVGLSRSVAKTKRLLTVEELSSHGGLYHSALGHCVGIAGLSCAQLAIFDFVRDYGTHDELLEKAGLSDRHIVEAMLSLMRLIEVRFMFDIKSQKVTKCQIGGHGNLDKLALRDSIDGNVRIL